MSDFRKYLEEKQYRDRSIASIFQNLNYLSKWCEVRELEVDFLNHENLIDYVHNVYLRDSTPENLQVRVGQGIIEYGKLINLLRKANFKKALCVDIGPSDDPEIDHDGELRTLRLLLESLVV